MSSIQPLNSIGLLGGMSWESSALYYSHINEQVRNRLGGLYSAPITLDSVNFAQMAEWQTTHRWDLATEHLISRARALESAGVKCIAIATNTMHKIYDEIAASVSVPVLHIATPTIEALKKAGFNRVAFLGTRYSMEHDFIRNVYAASGIELITPNQEDRDTVHNVIFDELCQGSVKDCSREAYCKIIQQLAEQGAQAVILGCTEIALLLDHEDCCIPMFDTTDLHTQALGEFILKDIA